MSIYEEIKGRLFKLFLKSRISPGCPLVVSHLIYNIKIRKINEKNKF